MPAVSIVCNGMQQDLFLLLTLNSKYMKKFSSKSIN